MLQHLLAQLDAARLTRRQHDLRRREQVAIARLGATTLADGGPREGRLSALAAEAATIRRRLHGLSPEKRAGAKSDPRQASLEAKLHQLHLTAGRLALAMSPTSESAAEIQAIRDELADTASEQARIQADSRRLAQDSWTDLQAWVRPRAPMLGSMVVGWWVARAYATSHTAAILTVFGRSTRVRGAHWISLTADTAIVHQGLPLAAAAVSAWLGHRLALRVRESVDEYRARTSQRARERAGPRAGAKPSAAGGPALAAERIRGGPEVRVSGRVENAR